MFKKYSVVFNKKYAKDLKQIHPVYHDAIRKAALSLAEDPRPLGCKKLKGSDNLYRIRVGSYRIIYTIQDDQLVILIIEIGDRKDIYN